MIEMSMHERNELAWPKTMPWLLRSRVIDWTLAWSLPADERRWYIATGRAPERQIAEAA